MRSTFLGIARVLAAVLPAGAIGAGPYDQPYTLFEADPYGKAQDRAPATILKIDGTETTRAGRPLPVPPGKHVVEVSVPGRRGMNHPEHQTLELETAPCTRYYLAAKRSSLTASDWAAFVSRSEPIGECARKFRLPPAAPR